METPLHASTTEASSTEDSTETNPGSAPRWIVWTMRFLCLFALGICCYLGWKALQASEVAGCAADGIWNCGHVLHSRWSKVLGLPVSLPAASIYLFMLGALALTGPRFSTTVRRWAWGGVTMAAVAAGTAAVWFVFLQVFVLKSLCAYCMTAHTTGLILCGLLIWARPLSSPALRRAFGSAGVLGVVAMVTTQLVTPPPATYAIESYDTQAADQIVAADAGEAHSDDATFDAPTDDALFEAPAVFDAPTVPAPESGPQIDDVSLRGNDAGIPPVPAPSPVPQQAGDTDAAADSDGDGNNSDGNDSDDAADATAGDSEDDDAPLAEPAAPRLAQFLGGRVSLNTAHWPAIGDPQAPHVLVELFDYTCPHCRTMNQHLQVARQRYGDQIAILTLPVPLDAQCNDTVASTRATHRSACELARTSIAVWRIAPEKFEAFHDWLFEPVGARSPSEAQQYARQLVGAAAFDKEIAKPIASQFIAKHVALYKRANRGEIPKLLFPNITVKGQMGTAEQLCRLLEEQFAVTPQQ